MHELLKCDHLSKQYDDGKDSVHILNNVNLTVHTSEQLAIIGSSGSGKSTLLHLLGALDPVSYTHLTLPTNREV